MREDLLIGLVLLKAVFFCLTKMGLLGIIFYFFWGSYSSSVGFAQEVIFAFDVWSLLVFTRLWLGGCSWLVHWLL